MAWTNIPDYILGQLFGYQSANLIKANIEYLRAVLGSPDTNSGVPTTFNSAEYKLNGTRVGFPPVGSIIGHYDFNALIAIDTNYWAYCKGQTISDAASPLNGQTLPNLTGRMLIGFGTDGNSDIDTATWGTTVQGNALHQVDISHTHDITMFFRDSSNNMYLATGGQNFSTQSNYSVPIISCGVISPQNFTTRSMSTTLGNATTTNACVTGGTGFTYTTASGGSTTLDIKPRSIRVRWIIRYK